MKTKSIEILTGLKILNDPTANYFYIVRKNAHFFSSWITVKYDPVFGSCYFSKN